MSLSIFCQTLTAQKKHDSPDSPTGPLKSPLHKENMFKTTCIVCKKSARASSIYCGDACILKHAQDSLGTQGTPSKSEAEGKTHEKIKPESRVSVSLKNQNPRKYLESTAHLTDQQVHYVNLLIKTDLYSAF